MKLKKLYRSFEVRAADIDAQARTVPLTFSSEFPADRWFGLEILDHGPGSVRLERAAMGLPVIDDHTGDQIGKTDAVEIGSDRKGHAVARFGKNGRADEIFRDIQDGIRSNISVGYMVYKMQLEKAEKDGPETYRATDWEPVEISVTRGAPADFTVGIGRAADGEEHEVEVTTTFPQPLPDPERGVRAVLKPAPTASTANNNQHHTRKAPTMEKCTKCGTELVNGSCPKCAEESRRAQAQSMTEAQNAERQRTRELLALGERHQAAEQARKFIDEGKSVEEFRAWILENVYKAKPVATPDPAIGLSDRETKQFSFMRAINALLAQNWKGAEFERECSDAVAQRIRKQPQGIFIPNEVQRARMDLQARDLVKWTGSAGGYLVGEQLLTASFIELLRNRMMVRKMGATILSGLVGDVAIPRQSGGATAYWVDENTAPTESQQTLGQVGLTPKTVGAYTDISRKLLLQASLDVENFVRSDLASVIALALDLAAIAGTGTDGQPQGIIYTTGIGSVAGGSTGLAPSYAHMVSLETEVAQDNADIGTLGYLTNAKVRGKLKQTVESTYAPGWIWKPGDEPGVGIVNGYKAGASNQVPSNLTKSSSIGVCSAIIFGNWADLVIAEWDGATDLLVDPYTGGGSGTVRVRLLKDVDVALRHVESFAAMLDALTT